MMIFYVFALLRVGAVSLLLQIGMFCLDVVVCGVFCGFWVLLCFVGGRYFCLWDGGVDDGIDSYNYVGVCIGDECSGDGCAVW